MKESRAWLHRSRGLPCVNLWKTTWRSRKGFPRMRQGLSRGTSEKEQAICEWHRKQNRHFATPTNQSDGNIKTSFSRRDYLFMTFYARCSIVTFTPEIGVLVRAPHTHAQPTQAGRPASQGSSPPDHAQYRFSTVCPWKFPKYASGCIQQPRE